MKNTCYVCGADFEDEDMAETRFHILNLCQQEQWPPEDVPMTGTVIPAAPAKTGFHCRQGGHPVASPSLLTGRAWCPPCQEYDMSDEDEKEAPHADI